MTAVHDSSPVLAAKPLDPGVEPGLSLLAAIVTIQGRSLRKWLMGKNDRDVVPGKDGGWDVRAPGASRAGAHTDRQADAIDRAREIVHNAGGGEVRIHGRDGRIRDSDTVAPGNDPNPPRDKR